MLEMPEDSSTIGLNLRPPLKDGKHYVRNQVPCWYVVVHNVSDPTSDLITLSPERSNEPNIRIRTPSILEHYDLTSPPSEAQARRIVTFACNLLNRYNADLEDLHTKGTPANLARRMVETLAISEYCDFSQVSTGWRGGFEVVRDPTNTPYKWNVYTINIAKSKLGMRLIFSVCPADGNDHVIQVLIRNLDFNKITELLTDNNRCPDNFFFKARGIDQNAKFELEDSDLTEAQQDLLLTLANYVQSSVWGKSGDYAMIQSYTARLIRPYTIKKFPFIHGPCDGKIGW